MKEEEQEKEEEGGLYRLLGHQIMMILSITIIAHCVCPRKASSCKAG